MSSKILYETNRFKLSKDTKGKYWLWNKVMQQNHAIRANSEIEAYQEAVNSLIFVCELIQGHRKTAESNLEKLLEVFREIEPSEEWICYKEWKAEGKLLGCNISSILKLAGTEYFPDFTDSILFIETYKSQPAKILFQLTQLEQLWVFDKIKWVVIGNNFGFQDKQYKADEVINEYLEKYDFPILKINEFGHYQPHAFFPIWAKVKLDATNKKVEIIDDFIM